MGYQVVMKFDDGETLEITDKGFETEQDAESAAIEWTENYKVGGEFLRDAEESYCDSEIIGWKIVDE